MEGKRIMSKLKKTTCKNIFFWLKYEFSKNDLFWHFLAKTGIFSLNRVKNAKKGHFLKIHICWVSTKFFN
jgi:hypothetical protein